MSLGAGTLGGGATAAAVAAAAAVCAAAAALLLAYRPQLWPAQHCRTWLSRHRGQSRKQVCIELLFQCSYLWQVAVLSTTLWNSPPIHPSSGICADGDPAL